MLVKSAQNRSISSEIWLENSHEIGLFYLLLFGKVSPQNFCEIGRFFHESVSENPAKLDFFPAT